MLLLGYGFPAAVGAMVGVLFYVYIPSLYSELYGVPLSVVGAVVFFSRVWDALLDPVVGYLSDRTKHRLGRRRVWVITSLPLLALVFLLLASPVRIDLPFWMPLWFTLGTCLFFLFWTTLSIPYEALGTELLGGYHERTHLYAVRQGFIVLGTLAAGALPAVLTIQLCGGELERWWWIGVVCAALLILACGVFILSVAEPTVRTSGSLSPSIRLALRSARQNPQFMTLLFSYTLSGIGASIPATLIVYYVRYVLGVSEPGVYLFSYFLTGFVFLPLWVILSKKIGKRDAWIYSMLVNTAAFIGVLLLQRGDTGLYLFLVCLSGIGYGGTLALPASMQADVLDLEERLRGNRREGEFIALWSIASKLAAAAGSGIAFPILTWTGFVPNAEQNAGTVLALAILYAGVPSLFNVLAVLVARRYELDEATLRGTVVP